MFEVYNKKTLLVSTRIESSEFDNLYLYCSYDLFLMIFVSHFDQFDWKLEFKLKNVPDLNSPG